VSIPLFRRQTSVTILPDCRLYSFRYESQLHSTMTVTETTQLEIYETHRLRSLKLNRSALKPDGNIAHLNSIYGISSANHHHHHPPSVRHSTSAISRKRTGLINQAFLMHCSAKNFLTIQV
jgi:hypothetical protein